MISENNSDQKLKYYFSILPSNNLKSTKKCINIYKIYINISLFMADKSITIISQI
jgi:hypothetical protein